MGQLHGMFWLLDQRLEGDLEPTNRIAKACETALASAYQGGSVPTRVDAIVFSITVLASVVPRRSLS